MKRMMAAMYAYDGGRMAGSTMTATISTMMLAIAVALSRTTDFIVEYFCVVT